MSIISISGRIGSGKDLTGKIIQYLVAQSKVGWTLPYTIEEYINGKDVYNVNHRKDYSESISEDSGWEIKKFTDKLKDIVCILLGCTREQLEDREFKEKELGEEWTIPLKEEFVDIKDYEGLYQISNYGNVKSLGRVINNGKYIRTSVDIISSTQYNTGGYKIVTLWKGKKKQTFTIHKLVATAFLTKNNTINGVINHIDNNKDNNKITNLEIVSQLYNSNCHKTTNGVRKNISGNYTVRVSINGSRVTLGTYKTEQEAVVVRNNKLKELDTFIPIKYIPKKYTPRLLLQLIGTELFRNNIHDNIWINALMCEYKEKITTESFYDIKTNNYTGITNKSKNNFPNWIITDMRFPNELKAVKDKGGICIRIERGRTSDEWQKRYPLIKVLDPDGWNRDERYHYEWYEEKITLQEYKNRVMRSTCKFTVDIKTFFSEHESETALDHITDWDYVIDNNSTIEDLVVKIEEILIKEQIIKKNGNTL